MTTFSIFNPAGSSEFNRLPISEGVKGCRNITSISSARFKISAGTDSTPGARAHSQSVGGTVFSRWVAGWQPHPRFGLEGGLHSAKDDVGARLYDAISVGARWRATAKWELEAFQTVNRLNGTALASAFTLRRYGHDFVFDLELSQRSAEGTSLGFSFRPLLGYRPSGLAQIDHWID